MSEPDQSRRSRVAEYQRIMRSMRYTEKLLFSFTIRRFSLRVYSGWRWDRYALRQNSVYHLGFITVVVKRRPK